MTDPRAASPWWKRRDFLKNSAAVAAGADGLLIEVHHAPETALCDGAQSLYPNQFRELMSQLHIIAPAVQRAMV